MKPNMGALDRLIRVILGIIFIVLIIAHAVPFVVMIILGIFAFVFILTGVLAFCPLYVPLKISTIVKKDKSRNKK